MAATPDEKRVSVRDIRNHVGDVLARVQRGETLTITSDGTPVAELRPPPATQPVCRGAGGAPATASPVDASALRGDIDALLDQSL
jgi:prevent-host-death family protein